MLNKSINGNWVAIDDPTQDALIPASNISDNVLDLGFGLHYHIPGKLNFGISSTHLNAGKLSGTNFAYTLARHYYVFGGYEHQLNDQLTLRPNFWLKSDVATTQVDVNVNVLWNNMLWGGLSYRLQDAIVPMLGYQGTLANGKGNYRVGYSYDITTSALRNHSSGSHELMLGFCYDIFPKPKITRYRNVRFL
jgi:type IX secretion system PorP/SprF family membrane protein